jgi:uncharacterized protein YejL (UPF0352 family)
MSLVPEKPKSPSTPWRRLTLKVFALGNKKVLHTKVCKAAKGHVFNEDGIQRILEEMSDVLERQLPQQEFRLVELGHGRFNFINETKAEEPDEAIIFRASVLPSSQPVDQGNGTEMGTPASPSPVDN